MFSCFVVAERENRLVKFFPLNDRPGPAFVCTYIIPGGNWPKRIDPLVGCCYSVVLGENVGGTTHSNERCCYDIAGKLKIYKCEIVMRKTDAENGELFCRW